MNKLEPSLEQYWTNRYENESTGWDLGSISEPLRQYFDQLEDKGLKILIPGAGNAYEAEYLFRSGFYNTHIVDISSIPLGNFKQRMTEFPSQQIIHGDFFELKDQYDLIIEQTFFCSFPPVDNFRKRYAEKMSDLLRPGGKLVGLWFDIPLKDDLSKRPFGGSKEEYESILGEYFTIHTLNKCYNSISGRDGDELFGIFMKE
ncbi:MAG: methyltransferase domain-containing protein [Crocinitomicaceae bacterium]